MRKKHVFGLLIAATLCAVGGMECFAQERNTPETSGDFATLVAGEQIFAGNPVGVLTNGLAYSAAQTNMALTVLGRAESTVDAGKRITVKRGTFRFTNLGVTTASLGQSAYSAFDIDGWGVASTASGGGASIVIGTVVNIDSDGVWVSIGK